MARETVTITLNGNKVDLSGPQGDVASSKYLLVKLTDSSIASRKAVENAGAKILSHEGENVYFCRYASPGSDIRPLRSITAVERIDPYPVSAKIHWELQDDIHFLLSGASAGSSSGSTGDPSVPGASTGGDAGGPPAGGSSSASAAPAESVSIPVKIFLYDDEPDDDAAEVVKQLVDSRIIKTEDTEIYPGLVNTTINSKDLAQVAALESVQVIEPRPKNRPYNDISRQILAADSPHLLSNDTVFDGKGETIAVGDSGLDDGKVWVDQQGAHPAFNWKTPTERLYIWSEDTPPENRLMDTGGHGTHVAASAVGSSQEILPMDPNQHHIQGTAPGANLVVMQLVKYTGRRWWDGSMEALFKRPYDHGARIFNESWGSDIKPNGKAYGYKSDARRIDRYVWEKDVFICWAAGNDSFENDKFTDMERVGGQAVAKNVLTVGASLSTRPTKEEVNTNKELNYIFEEASPPGDSWGMAGFSNKGFMGKRYKPDVVAPGTLILSARSRALNDEAKATANDAGKSENPNFMFLSGTSMASPLVAGCAAVLRQAVKSVSEPGFEPSSALIKALIINGAVPLGTGDIPDKAWGFGRVNLQASLNHLNWSDPPDVGAGAKAGFKQGTLKDTQSVSLLPIEVGKGQEVDLTKENLLSRLKVTMVYVDRGHKTIQCKLHVWIEKEGDKPKWYGNRKKGDEHPDEENNVQQLIWDSMEPGNYLIGIKCTETVESTDEVRYAVAWYLSDSVDCT